METENLIRTMVADLARPTPLRSRFALALCAGIAVAAAMFAVMLGPRDDFAQAMHTVRFDFKFVVTLTLAAGAFALVLRMARPAAATHLPALACAAGPVLLLAGVLAELMVLPSSAWSMTLVGKNSMMCLRSIPLLSVPLLIAVLAALRSGAPTRPALSGAIAGLVAGGLAAALYAANCTDDSPLFVVTWYTLAIGLVAGAGALCGRFLLRW